MNKRKELTKRFRKVAWGRLYWRQAHLGWRDFFDSDDVAVVRNAPVSTHYKSLAALEEDIDREEKAGVMNARAVDVSPTVRGT